MLHSSTLEVSRKGKRYIGRGYQEERGEGKVYAIGENRTRRKRSNRTLAQDALL